METWRRNAYKIQTEIGLNRTMQYGNCSIPCKDNSELPSLNRTMKYGNKQAQKNINILTRLNRTMQYGNLHMWKHNQPFFSV